MPPPDTPQPEPTPPAHASENVVYLTEEAARSRGAIPANPHANDYGTAAASPEQLQAEELRRRAADMQAELQAQLPAFGSHGPIPQPSELTPPPTVDDNPFGDFFADGPTAWLVDDDAHEDEIELATPRIAGTMLALGAILMLVAAWTIWGIGMYRGAGGAEAGGFIMLAIILWASYLSLGREKQHAAMLRWHHRVRGLVDRRVDPLRERTEGQMQLRRERDRYRAMADERARRINSLGEAAYRQFRQGTLAPDLQVGAQRVLAMERQMLVQDQRIHGIERDRAERSRKKRRSDDDAPTQAGGHLGTDAASPPPAGGHPAP